MKDAKIRTLAAAVLIFRTGPSWDLGCDCQPEEQGLDTNFIYHGQPQRENRPLTAANAATRLDNRVRHQTPYTAK